MIHYSNEKKNAIGVYIIYLLKSVTNLSIVKYVVRIRIIVANTAVANTHV